MKKATVCERVTELLDDFDNVRARRLTRSERRALRAAEKRLTKLVRLDPEEPVELSPYIKSLLGENFDDQFGVRERAHARIASSV